MAINLLWLNFVDSLSREREKLTGRAQPRSLRARDRIHAMLGKPFIADQQRVKLLAMC